MVIWIFSDIGKSFIISVNQIPQIGNSYFQYKVKIN